MLQHFAAWLANTPASLFIQNVLWIIPTVQTIHILAIAVVMSSVAMIDLRILGLAGRGTTISETAHRFVPWIWVALVVLALSGATLITGEPVRSLVNPAFQFKMVLLVVAILITAAFQVTVQRKVSFWDMSPKHAPLAKLFALGTLMIWFAIAVAGRWIAYMILDYTA